MVHTQAVVGEIADDTAVLTSETLQLFRMPLALLPHPLTVGTVIDLHAAFNPAARAEREASVREVQRALCARLQLSPTGPSEPEQVGVPFSHPLPPLPSGALLEVAALPPASSSAANRSLRLSTSESTSATDSRLHFQFAPRKKERPSG